MGGKTGAAQKPKAGGYSSEIITTFFAAFPMDKPQYLLLVMLDEPRTTEAAKNRTEAAWNAAPIAGAIIKRAAPMLGLTPSRPFGEMAMAAYYQTKKGQGKRPYGRP